ncbi:MAG TPA: M56 family metallopeptidase [Lachnospiraceae bacterium]|nr:M56 family metallopeptidase [Lachnospiraceae bacterium]
MSLAAGLLIIIIIVIRKIAIQKLPKKLFVILWGVVLIRLLFPISFQTPMSNNISKELTNLFYKMTGLDKDNYAAISQGVAISTEQVKIKPAETQLEQMHGNVGSNSSIVTITDKDIADNKFANTLEQSSNDVKVRDNLPIVYLIWLLGGLGVAAFFTVSYVKEYRRLQEALPIRKDEWLDSFIGQLSLKRKVRVMVSDRIASPVTYGIVKPRIVLPKVMDMRDYEQMKYILTHEIVHIRRFDTLWKIVTVIAVSVHWFNPLVWIMYILFNRDLEIACDEKVISILGENEKQAYALTLISMAEQKLGLPMLSNSFGRNAVQERIVSIMRYRKPKLLGFIVTILILVASTNVFVSTVPADNGKDDNETYIAVASTEDSMVGKENTRIATAIISDDPTTENVRATIVNDDPVTVSDTVESVSNVSNLERESTSVSYGIEMASNDNDPSTQKDMNDVDSNREDAYQEMKKTNILNEEEVQSVLTIYEAYGLSYDAATDEIYYEGNVVREFYDEATGLFVARSVGSLYPKGSVDVRAVYKDKKLVGLRLATEKEYSERTREREENSRKVRAKIAGQYAQYGLKYDSSTDKLYYNNMVVHSLTDTLNGITFYYSMEEGTIDVQTNFDAMKGEITGIVISN